MSGTKSWLNHDPWYRTTRAAERGYLAPESVSILLRVEVGIHRRIYAFDGRIGC